MAIAHPDISNIEAFLRLFKPQKTEMPAKRLLFLGEQHAENMSADGVRVENAQTHAAAIQAAHLAAPGERLAVFYELPPEAHPGKTTFQLQAAVNHYMETGEIPAHEAKMLSMLLPALQDARKTGAGFFLIDDTASVDSVVEANNQSLFKRLGLDKDGPQSGKSAGEVLMETLHTRNEVMAERVASILKGTNQEPLYAAQMEKGGFTRALVINGALHFADRNDINELVLKKLEGHPHFNPQTAYVLEVFKDKNGPAVIHAPDNHMFGGAQAMPDKPDAAINSYEHISYGDAVRNIRSIISRTQIEAFKTRDTKEDDVGVGKLLKIVDSFYMEADPTKALAKTTKEIDGLQGVSDHVKQLVKTYMGVIATYDRTEGHRTDAAMAALHIPGENNRDRTR